MSKQKIPSTVKDILVKAEVGDLFRDFEKRDLPKTKILIIISQDENGLITEDHAGVSDIGALGLIEVAKNMILTKADFGIND